MSDLDQARRTDPEYDKKYRERCSKGGKLGGSKGGTTSTKQQWQCDECGKITIAPALGQHQKYSGHTGRTRLS